MSQDPNTDPLTEFLLFMNRGGVRDGDVDEPFLQQQLHLAVAVTEGLRQQESSARGDVITAFEKGMAATDPRVRALAASSKYRLDGDAAAFETALAAAADITGSSGFLAATYYALSVIDFNPGDEFGPVRHMVTRERRRAAYRKALAQVRAELAACPRAPAKGQEVDWTVLLTGQFLQPPHAPTVTALEFARALKVEHGKQVAIVNTLEMTPAIDGCINPCARYTVAERMAGQHQLQFGDMRIPYFQAPVAAFGPRAIQFTAQVMDMLQPSLVIGIGASNLMSDAFVGEAFSFRFATTSDLPLVDGVYFHTWSDPDAAMQRDMKTEGIADHYLFAKHPGFDIPAAGKTLTRTALALPEEAFVFAVVGMRLDTEVDSAFAACMTDILGHPKAHIAFAGPFDRFGDLMAAHPEFAGRVSHVGFQDDIMAFYSAVDASLNPRRIGGGRGVAYSLGAGLPTLSLPYGDGGAAVKPLPPLADYSEMAARAKALVDDTDLRGTYARAALEAAKDISGRSALVTRILDAKAAHEGGTLKGGFAAPE